MGLFSKSKAKKEIRSTDVNTTSDGYSFFVNGVDMNLLANFRESRSLAAVYACIELISNSLSCIPLTVVRRNADGN